MRAVLLVALVGCANNRVDRDREPPTVEEAAPAAVTDQIGCDDADGPCLIPGPIVWDGASELCLEGGGLGDGGTLYWSAVARATTSWSDTRICVAASPPEHDALVQVILDDGRRSNREAVATPAYDLEWSYPEPLREGMRVTVRGKNLGAHVAGRWANGEVHELYAQRYSQLSFGKPGHDPIPGPSVTVAPNLVYGCAAGPRQPCTVGGLGFDTESAATANPSGHTVTVDGRAATWTDWSANAVTFEWPSGLNPGPHTVEMTVGDGTTATVAVEMLDHDILELTDFTDFSTIRQVDPYQPDPFVHGGWLLASGEYGGRGIGGTPVLDATRHLRVVDPDAAVVTRGYVGQRGLLVEWEGGLWNLTVEGAVPVSVDPTDRIPEIDLASARAFTMGSTSDWVVAAHDRGGVLLAATMEGRTPRMWAITPPADRVALDGPAGELLTAAYSPAVWIGDDAVWTGGCGNEEAATGMWVAPIDASNGLQIGPPTAIWTGATGEKALACRVDDQGLLFVTGDGVNPATVHRHSLSGGLVTVGTLPATLPGQGTALATAGESPVASIAEAPDGTLVALLVDRSDTPHELTLATSADGATWSTSAPFGTRMADLYGDSCVGGASVCENVRAEPTSCVPVACPVEQRTLVDWREGRGVATFMQIWRAGMRLDGDGAWVQYEAIRGPQRPYADSEFLPHVTQIERVPLP